MMGPCAKVVVRCTLIATDGSRFVGQNDCANPQLTCPRLPGEGYDKCVNICRQEGHAEEVAVRLAGPKAAGAEAFIEGHHRICDNCQLVLADAGITSACLGTPPQENQ